MAQLAYLLYLWLYWGCIAIAYLVALLATLYFGLYVLYYVLLGG